MALCTVLSWAMDAYVKKLATVSGLGVENSAKHIKYRSEVTEINWVMER